MRNCCSALLLLLLLLPALLTAQQDVTPPSLKSISFSPSSIDVTSRAAVVNVIVLVEDYPAGLMYACVMLQGPSGQQHSAVSFWSQIAGSPQNGIYSAELVFPVGSEAGAWNVSQIALFDSVGNFTVLWQADLIDSGLPATVTIISDADLNPPAISSLDVTPARVDVVSAPAQVSVAATIVDDCTGVASASLAFRSPGGGQMATAVLTPAPDGSAQQASYLGTLTIPEHAEAGTWTIDSFSLKDNAGNAATYNHQTLASMGLAASFSVTSEPVVAGPALMAFSFAPGTVDTALAPATLRVRMRIRETVAGFQSGYVTFKSPSGQTATAVFYPPAVYASLAGSDYEADLVIPTYSEQGEWAVDHLYLADRAGNGTLVMGVQMEAAYLQTKFVNGPAVSPEAARAKPKRQPK